MYKGLHLAGSLAKREGAEVSSVVLGIVWGFLLCLYGVIPTLQPSHFGRVYAAYGGFFIVLSFLWGWTVDGDLPDRFDVIGATISLTGVLIVIYWPR